MGTISLLDERLLSYLLVDTKWQVEVVDEVDSTQNVIKLKKSISNGDVVVAEFQSAGRGRLDRTFEASKSQSLTFSFYIECFRDRKEWGCIPLIAGLAVTNVLNAYASEDSEKIFYAKWPNDVLAINSKRDGKVAGILTETHGNGIVVGIGINVEMENLPVETATSLLLLGISHLNRNEILVRVLNEFHSLFTSWERGGSLAKSYLDISATIGKKVEVSMPGGEVKRGVAIEVGHNGELVLDSGESIFSGDVIHLYT